MRRTVDGYDNNVTAVGPIPGMQSQAFRRVDDVTRSASLPVIIPESGRRPVFNSHGVGLSDEPNDIAHGLAAASLSDNEYGGPNELPSRGKGLERMDTLVIEDNVDHREPLLPSTEES